MNKILVIKTRSIGDNIVMIPALMAIREKYTDSCIKVLTTEEAAEPLLYLPFIDGVYRFQKKKFLPLRIFNILKVLKEVRAENFDICINLQASEGSEKLSLFSGAKKRLIYPYKYGKRSRYSHYNVGKPTEKMPVVLEDIRALEPLGIKRKEVKFLYPISQVIRETGEKILLREKLKSKKFVVIHPGAGDKEKIWHFRNYVALIEMIEKELSLKTALIYTDKEQHLYKNISSLLGKHIVGINTSFDILAAIMKESIAFIGSDSAPLHLACAIGIPTICIMNRDKRTSWHPYNPERHFVIVGELEEGNEDFINRIKPEKVFKHFKKLLENEK